MAERTSLAFAKQAAMARLLGVWHSADAPHWPAPRHLVDDRWDAGERAKVVQYLRAHRRSAESAGSSYAAVLDALGLCALDVHGELALRVALIGAFESRTAPRATSSASTGGPGRCVGRAPSIPPRSVRPRSSGAGSLDA